MISRFVLNAILHHVVLLSIISYNKEMKYEIDKSDHPNCLYKGPWYNTAFCLRLHRSLFEYNLTNARTDRYNLLCSLVSHDKNNLRMKIKKALLDIG